MDTLYEYGKELGGIVLGAASFLVFVGLVTLLTVSLSNLYQNLKSKKVAEPAGGEPQPQRSGNASGAEVASQPEPQEAEPEPTTRPPADLAPGEKR